MRLCQCAVALSQPSASSCSSTSTRRDDFFTIHALPPVTGKQLPPSQGLPLGLISCPAPYLN